MGPAPSTGLVRGEGGRRHIPLPPPQFTPVWTDYRVLTPSTCFLEVGEECVIRIYESANREYCHYYYFNDQHPYTVKIEPNPWKTVDHYLLNIYPTRYYNGREYYKIFLTGLNPGYTEIRLDDRTYFRYRITVYHRIRFFGVCVLSHLVPNTVFTKDTIAWYLLMTQTVTFIVHILLRLSVEGLSLEFLLFQLVSDISRGIYEYFISLPHVQESIREETFGVFDPIQLANMYFHRDKQIQSFNPGSPYLNPSIPGHVDIFPIPIALTSVTVLLWIVLHKTSSNGFNLFAINIVAGLFANVVVVAVMNGTQDLNEVNKNYFLPWSHLLFFVRNIGKLCSVVKYIPQVYLIITNRSSYGFNFMYPLIGFGAWNLRITSMSLLARNFGDLCYYFCDPAGLISDVTELMFNIAFFVLYFVFLTVSLKKEKANMKWLTKREGAPVKKKKKKKKKKKEKKPKPKSEYEYELETTEEIPGQKEDAKISKRTIKSRSRQSQGKRARSSFTQFYGGLSKRTLTKSAARRKSIKSKASRMPSLRKPTLPISRKSMRSRRTVVPPATVVLGRRHLSRYRMNYETAWEIYKERYKIMLTLNDIKTYLQEEGQIHIPIPSRSWSTSLA